MSTQKTETKLKDVVQQMNDDGCEFLMDSNNQATVNIKDDAFQQDWPANHERVHDYLITLYYDLSGGMTLKSSDLQLLMALLREECRNGERRLSQAEEEATNGDVLVQVILWYLSKHEKFEGRTCDLLKALKSVEEEKLPFSSDFPVFVNVFSRRMRRRVPTLRGLGVGVVLEHKEEGSFCTLKRLENFQPDGDDDGVTTQSSGKNPVQGRSLAPADDTDGQVRKEGRRDDTETTDGKGGVK